MEALLGRITAISRKESALGWLEVSLKPICVLPLRTKPPEWLNDQVLKIEREVPDSREIGVPGDNIVLTCDESAKWLHPLVVSPEIARGELPEKICLSLRWWKNDDPPEFAVTANGRLHAAKFSKEEGEFRAEVETSAFYDSAPQLPVDFSISFDKVNLACTILPKDQPYWRKIMSNADEVHRVENDWFTVDFSAKSHAGGIVSVVEKGRDVDHFCTQKNLIQARFANAGHVDRICRTWGWWPQMNEVAMTSAGARREDNSTRLQLDGVLDEGQNLRTSVSFMVPDIIPLILIRRDYFFHSVKKKDDEKGKEERPKEVVDDLSTIGLGMRTAWAPDIESTSGTRILCIDNNRVSSLRCSRVGDGCYAHSWRMCDGWTLVEHPIRNEYTMYLFDPEFMPYLRSCFETRFVSFEPSWPKVIARPGSTIGMSYAMAFGECGGISADGGWIACRTKLPGGGIKCAVICRIRSIPATATASFTLGDKVRKVSLERMHMAGIGELSFATADFPDGRMNDNFDVMAAGISSRRLK